MYELCTKAVAAKLCSLGDWLRLKCSVIGPGVIEAETNYGIIDVLGLLLMISS